MRIINEIDFLFPLKRSSLFKMLLLDTRRWENGHPCIIFVCDPRIMFFLFTMSCGCKKILTSAVAFVFFFPRYHFRSVLFQFCAAIISCATDWKGWKCLISYLGLFVFLNTIIWTTKLEIPSMKCLYSVWFLYMISLHFRPSKTHFMAACPWKHRALKQMCWGEGGGGMLVSRLVRTIREKCAFMTSRVLY